MKNINSSELTGTINKILSKHNIELTLKPYVDLDIQYEDGTVKMAENRF